MPPSARSSPSRMRSVVVLPAPFGPRKPWTSPRSTAKVEPVERARAPERLGEGLRRDGAGHAGPSVDDRPDWSPGVYRTLRPACRGAMSQPKRVWMTAMPSAASVHQPFARRRSPPCAGRWPFRRSPPASRVLPVGAALAHECDGLSHGPEPRGQEAQESPSTSGRSATRVGDQTSGATSTPRSTTVKPRASSSVTAMFLPMSWMSPLTVAMTTLREPWATPWPPAGEAGCPRPGGRSPRP